MGFLRCHTCGKTLSVLDNSNIYCSRCRNKELLKAKLEEEEFVKKGMEQILGDSKLRVLNDMANNLESVEEEEEEDFLR